MCFETVIFNGDYNVVTRKREICRFVDEDFLEPMVYILSNSVAYRERKSIRIMLSECLLPGQRSEIKDQGVPGS